MTPQIENLIGCSSPIPNSQTKPMDYVALVADASGRYAHVHGTAESWHEYIDQLEDIGCEVVENQTDDYDSFDLDNLKECGVIPISLLLKDTDFIPFS